MAELTVEFCGEWYTPAPDAVFTIGREGDLRIDDNPYLHRVFLQIVCRDSLWWLANVGSLLSATIADGSGGMQAWLPPGAQLPLVFGQTTVVFTAGSTTYELAIHIATPTFRADPRTADASGETTIGMVVFTPSQKALIVALAEPSLRRGGTGFANIPSSAKAAERLGWSQSKFNRKLDNVCEKLDRVGVTGLRASGGGPASNRRARLVEHAITSHLVTADDLAILDTPIDD
ncbi:hypothetical protein [Tersicoccus sp. Bi-70]|uniref:hypothetical protein n=1 Tax=Tersicoccus sp. Bi-70 TaxID=1897634 RepID=UPI0009765295|nr:hypothetical protein [Tersicoccus sp. Bi-70]OMH31315.1 hypothetical protein BGP79_09830 [Tersicoccus sp. Bi-70]